MTTSDLFEAMHTLRAMRRLKPDPVPDELIAKILRAGMQAPNGGNTQKWRFLVIKDPAIKKAVQAWYKKAYDEVIGPRYGSSEPPPGVTKEKYKRQHDAVDPAVVADLLLQPFARAVGAAAIGDDVTKALRGPVLVPSLTDLAAVSFARLGTSKAMLEANVRAIYAQDPASTTSNPARSAVHALGPEMFNRVAAIEGIGAAAPPKRSRVSQHQLRKKDAGSCTYHSFRTWPGGRDGRGSRTARGSGRDRRRSSRRASSLGAGAPELWRANIALTGLG